MTCDPFADIRDKRMSELNEEQTLRATELWLRTNIGPSESYWYPHLQVLFRIIDKLRAPIDMVLHCPNCGLQHIDAPGMNSEFDDHTWDNPPHRSHLCHRCGHIWRPADVATNGVAAVKTRGKNDSLVKGCACGDRAAALCPGQWEPGCDLGANEKYVRVSAAEPLPIDREEIDELEAVDRMVKRAEEQGMLVEVISTFGSERASGATVQEAAFSALYEWDIA